MLWSFQVVADVGQLEAPARSEILVEFVGDGEQQTRRQGDGERVSLSPPLPCPLRARWRRSNARRKKSHTTGPPLNPPQRGGSLFSPLWGELEGGKGRLRIFMVCYFFRLAK